MTIEVLVIIVNNTTLNVVTAARRRRLSFGRDDFLSSAAKKLSNTASEDLKSSGDFHDLHQHLVWNKLKFQITSEI